MGYATDAPAVFTGNKDALSVGVHYYTNPYTNKQMLTMFSDPTAAAAAFSYPTGLQVGSRNILHGPTFFNLDLSLHKQVKIYKRYQLELSAEAYNALNHVNFSLPGGGSSSAGADISSSSFGRVTGTENAARVMQFGAQLSF